MKMLAQRVKLDISFVHKIVRGGLYRYLIQYFGIMNYVISQMNKRSGAIYLGMQYDCSFLMMKLSQ